MDILVQRQIDIRGFVELFRKLEESAPSGRLPEILASHPQISKRIDYILQAAGNSRINENPRLKAIFEKLK